MADFPEWSHLHRDSDVTDSRQSSPHQGRRHSNNLQSNPTHVIMPHLGEAFYEQSQWFRSDQQDLLKPIADIGGLIQHLENIYFEDKLDFSLLHRFNSEFLCTPYGRETHKSTLHEIVRLAQMLPQLMHAPVKLLRAESNNSAVLKKTQIASLLANAFLCTFLDRKKDEGKFCTYPSINFASLYRSRGEPADSVNIEKLKCLFSYFKSVSFKMSNDSEDDIGSVEFIRVHQRENVHWVDSTRSLKLFHMGSTIDDFEHSQHIQVDFVDKRIGGGVFGRGCLREEIRFITCPELIVARLFTEQLGVDEALVVRGVEQYCTYDGYKHTFRYKGPKQDDPALASKRVLVAIDALDFSREDHSFKSRVGASLKQCLEENFRPQKYRWKIDRYADHAYEYGLAQYAQVAIDRELNKAYAGFNCKNVNGVPPRAHIATGNWGGGASGGDPVLKAKIQHLAASQANRELHYYPFGDSDLQNEVSRAVLYSGTVQDGYKELLHYAKNKIGELLNDAEDLANPSY